MLTTSPSRTRRIPFALVMLLILSIVYASKGEAKVIRDQLGRSVSVPDNPVRVVSLAPSITEIVFALGEGNRLKGVTEHCDYPEEARELPRIGSYVHLDLERIVALTPDLCIAVRDGNPRNVVDRLEELGIPVYAVDPRNLDTAVDTVLELGRLLGATPRAEALADSMRARIERVRVSAARTDHRPRVFFQIGIAPIVSSGDNTVINELITTAGGLNLAAGPLPYPRFSREQVVALNPEVFIITSMTRDQDLDQVKNAWKQYDTLQAVRDGRIFVVDANLFDRPTPRLVDGLETLAAIIHPELF